MPNKDQLEGKAREFGGSAQEKAGNITGNEDLEARGVANRGEGKAQSAFGDAKEKAEDIKDKIEDAAGDLKNKVAHH